MRLVFVATACVAGCFFPSLSGLTGDGGSDGAADAPSDGLTVIDGSDASPDAPVGRFCATVTPPPTYCEDFDEPDGGPAFGNTTETAGGTVTEDTTVFRSPPRSLLANAPAATSTAVQAAAYASLGPAPTTSAKLSFDVDLTTGDTETALGGLVSNTGTNVYLLVGTGTICVQEGAYATGPTYPIHPCHAVDWTKGWTHVELTLTHSGGSVTTSLSVDNVVLESNYTCDSRFNLQALVVGLGWTYIASPGAARAAHVDNVVAYDQ